MSKQFSLLAFAVAAGLALAFRVASIPDPIVLLALAGVVVTALITVLTPLRMAGLPAGVGSVVAVWSHLPGPGLPGLLLSSALGTCLLAGVTLWMLAGNGGERAGG